MDISKLLKDVKNLDNFMALTQDLVYKYKNANILFNMTTVLSLKNIRSLEIEYFHKCDDSGAAFIIFERMLHQSPSTTWSLLGKELVSLIQYWLDAVRKHLITHHPHWWTFLKHLLKFVKELIKKDLRLNDMLIEQTTDCFLDLALRDRLNTNQRHEILYTLNMFCAESSREIRYALKTEFEHYFVGLSTIMATCGHQPTQYSIMETLLRWLIPRGDHSTRREAAAKWFPEHLFSRTVVNVFLERPWQNFYQDARDFLNALNETSDLVTSVVCRKLFVGNHVLVSGAERRVTWLDINTADGCISVQLDPRPLEGCGAERHKSYETLTVASEATVAAKLYREFADVTILVTTTGPPPLYPSSGCTFGSGAGGQQVKVVVSSRSDMARVDNALRSVFHDKYEVLLDFVNIQSLSPLLTDFNRKSDEDTRFSYNTPKVNKRRKNSGYAVRSETSFNHPRTSFKSPSTVSTSSLVQLREKINAFPRSKFDKKFESVLAQPDLSEVAESSETSGNIRSTCGTDSTLKLRTCGIKSYNDTKKTLGYNDVSEEKATEISNGLDGKQSSDIRNYNVINENRRNVSNFRDKFNEDSISCLMIATIGSADQSVINDTFERLPKGKDFTSDNIAELLAQEALKVKNGEDNDCLLDSGIITEDDKKSQDLVEEIKSTPNAPNFTVVRSNQLQKKNCTVISKSTSDESNTEAINEPPISYVCVRKRNQCKTSVRRSCEQHTLDEKIKYIPHTNDVLKLDAQTVEDYFTQHLSENKAGELIISPTLAKKINTTSSESSEDFNQCIMSNKRDNLNTEQELPNIEIKECVNEMVDKISNDFDNCTEYLNKEDKELETMNITEHRNVDDDVANKMLRQDNGNDSKTKNRTMNNKSKSRNIKSKRNVKLTFTETKTLKANKRKKNVKEMAKPSIMSPIIEVNKDIRDVMSVKNNSPETRKASDTTEYNETDTPLLIRRKRKLYSPKDDYVLSDNVNENLIVSDIEYDLSHSEFKKRTLTPKSTTACDEELKTELKYKRLRTRKSRGKTDSINVSPKTNKNNCMFDALKENIETSNKITLADKNDCDKDIAIFNFTSDSEDEDFKKKKNDLQKRVSTTTIESGNSVISTRFGRRKKIDYTEHKCAESTDEAKKKTSNAKRKRVTKLKKSKTSARNNVNPVTELENERMRETIPEELNTSLLIEKPSKKIEDEELNPAIQAPQLELVIENEVNEKPNETILEKKKKIHKPVKKQKAAEQVAVLVEEDKDGDRTISPLPGLVVETVPTVQMHDGDDSLISNIVHKINKLCQEGAINDTNTTHNLISDAERTNCSVQMNVTEEFDMIGEVNSRYKGVTDKEKAPSFVSHIDNINVPVNNESFRDDESVVSTKNLRLNRTLRLKNKKGVNKSTEKEVVCLEKPKTCLMGPENNKERDEKGHSQSRYIDAQFSNKKDNSKRSGEIISIDDECYSQNRIESKSFKIPMETIDISDVTDMKSEKSIATEGITGHGYASEDPPNLRTLKEILIPRELEDMDETIKEYYIKLGREIDVSNNGCKEGTNQSIEKENVISPVVSIKRLSMDDLSKWLVQDVVPEKPTKDQANKSLHDYSRWLPSRKNSESNSSDISKASKSDVKSPIVSIDRLPDNLFELFMSPKSKKETKKCATDILNKNPEVKEPNSRNITPPKASIKRYASLISPIKLFGDAIFTRSKRKLQDDTSEAKTLKENHNTSSRNDFSTSQSFKTPRHKPSVLKNISLVNIDTSPDSKVSNSASTRIEDSRARPLDGAKRLRLEDDITTPEVVLCKSGTRVSSITEWIRTQPSSSTDQNLRETVRDAMRNILEKLDTTLAEIDRDTTKNFMNLLASTQKKNNEKEEEMLQIVDRLKTSIQQRHRESMEVLKEEGIRFIREGRTKKQLMVSLIREDVQAALELMDGGRET